jgi:hypothetical protein
MASTIKLKNGSGAPTTGDLVQGEPALDLTNKRLYTENASGVVIEVGTNPTSITTGNITANGTINLTGATVSNAGSITTADINGGTIDGTVIGGSTAAAITGTTITGTSFVSSGDMTFGDSDKAIFGAGSDLQIYHDGSHSIIADAGSGNLQIRANDFQLLNAANTQNIIRGYDATGAVSLHYGGAEKLATSSSGVYVTGTVTADGLTVTGSDAALAASIGTDAQRVYITPNGTVINYNASGDSAGSHMFQTGNVNRLNIASNGDLSLYEDTGTTAKLFWDASEERLGIGTTSPSVHLDVEGTAQVNLLEVTHDGDRAVNFVRTGANTFSIEHDITQFYFWNQTTSESPLLFQNDGDVIMNGGNVGIGTSSPSRKVSLADSVNGYNLELQQTSAYNSGNQSGIVFSAPYNIGGSVTDLASIRGGKENATDEDFGGKLAFYTRANGGSDTERMRIDSSGNVGIGVVPSSWASNTFDALQLGVGIGVGNLTARVDGINAVGLGLNWYYGGGATNTYVASSFATNYVQEAGTHKWLHAASGTAGAALTFTESMRIDSSGNLLVGTTTNLIWNTTNLTGCVIGGNSSSGGFSSIQVSRVSDLCLLLNRLTSDGQIQAFARQGTQVGEITVTTSSTSYNTSSDYRLKENIADADDAGSKIDAIKVRKFDWKADGSHQDYGMVAQELMTVAPEAVSVPEDPEKMMGVDYSKLVPMMLKEIQSLRARVAQLEGAN